MTQDDQGVTGGPTSSGWAGLMVLYMIVGMAGLWLISKGLRSYVDDPRLGVAYSLVGIFVMVVTFMGLALYRRQTRTDRTKRITVANWRIVAMVIWLGIINMMIFGVPHFSTTPLARYFFWPNLSTRFFVYNPTTCIEYEMNLEILNGAQVYYMNLWVPILIFYVLIFIGGRFWCGWLCPMYFLQDGISRIRSASKIAYWNLPPKVIMALDRFKYIILFTIVWGGIGSVTGLLPQGLRTQTPLSCEICPARPTCLIAQQSSGVESWNVKIPWLSALTGICLILLSFKIRNFWCRICPLGAMMAPMNKYALLRLEKEGDRCTRCRICARVCPMDIEDIYEVKDKRNVTFSTCVHCYKCIEKCPEKDCLHVVFAGKRLMSSKSLDTNVSPNARGTGGQ